MVAVGKRDTKRKLKERLRFGFRAGSHCHGEVDTMVQRLEVSPSQVYGARLLSGLRAYTLSWVQIPPPPVGSSRVEFVALAA